MDPFPIYTIDIAEELPQLLEIPQPPTILTIRGSLERMRHTTFVTVVGSRNCTPYGIEACKELIQGLAGYPVTIVSGLAYGIDAVAHQAALDAGLPTIAFPGSGLDWNVIYPKQNRDLAEAILKSGGALISEFAHGHKVAPWNFPLRNRLEAGIASMVIVIEAGEKSGTLITARLGTEYNRIVGAVPGPITSPTSTGANWLLKLGAVPITEHRDIVYELRLPSPEELPFRSYD